MKRIRQIKLNTIKEFFKKIPGTLAEHAFLTSLVLVFISLIIGGLLFYQAAFLAKITELESREKIIKFKENLYQEVLEKWEAKEKRFKEAEIKEYPDPFR